MKTEKDNLKQKKSSKKPVPNLNKTEDLHTDSPISEKDEVKRAEDKMRKTIKKS